MFRTRNAPFLLTLAGRCLRPRWVRCRCSDPLADTAPVREPGLFTTCASNAFCAVWGPAVINGFFCRNTPLGIQRVFPGSQRALTEPRATIQSTVAFGALAAFTAVASSAFGMDLMGMGLKGMGMALGARGKRAGGRLRHIQRLPRLQSHCRTFRHTLCTTTCT